MYILKEDVANELRNKYKNKYLADTIGISLPYVSYILHRKRHISKTLAYFFTKTIDSEKEIDDLFELV